MNDNNNIINAIEAYEIAVKSYNKNFYTAQNTVMNQIKSAAKRGNFKAVILFESKYSSMIDQIKNWLIQLNYTIDRDRIDNYTCHELTISWKNIPEN